MAQVGLSQAAHRLAMAAAMVVAEAPLGLAVAVAVARVAIRAVVVMEAQEAVGA